jgi:flagellar biosynthesis protein FlhB
MLCIGHYRRLTEQPFEQRNENAANQGNAAARHELFHALALFLCVIKK